MVTEQVTDGYGKAVSFETPSDDLHGGTLVVQNRVSLQRPRSTFSSSTLHSMLM